MEPLRVGSVPRGLGTPDLYVTVLDGTKPVLRIDVYGDLSREMFICSAAIIWQNWIAIGFGHHLYLVGLHDRTILTISLLNYFVELYVGPEYLLAASASRLFRVESDGGLLWKSDELGIDGVMVMDMNAEIVKGKGEWDPPGGWRPFTVNAANGELIESG